MRLLLTGAGGMLGHDVRAAASAAGHDVIALTHAELDITAADAVSAAVAGAHPEVVINCAAYTDVDGAQGAGRDIAHAVNGEGPGNLARAASAVRAHTIHISTDYVFDGAKTGGPYLESDTPNPRSVYGASKLAGERSVAREAPSSHTIVRSSWLYGQHGACFPDTIIRLARERDRLAVVDDQRGCPTFTADLADALIDLGARARPPLGVVHIVGGGDCTWFELARETLALAGSSMKPTPCSSTDFQRPAPRPAYSVLGSERADELPVLRDWHAALREYVQAWQVRDVHLRALEARR